MNKENHLKKPIFIIGHARGGSTLLGAIVNAHPEVGPKYIKGKNLNTEFLKDNVRHFNLSTKLEQKDIWFKYFKGINSFTHMGMEIYEDSLTLDEVEIKNLILELTKDFKEERFLSKAPTNSFRIRPICQIFPDCKIVVILRKGEEVVASWGRRSYGFGKKVNWGEVKSEKLGYFEGINIFVKKWKEVIDVVKESKNLSNLRITTYESLTNDTENTIKKIFEFLELSDVPSEKEIVLNKECGKWKKTIPKVFQIYLLLKVRKGNRMIKKLENL